MIESDGFMNRYNATADEVFDWYVSNETADQYFGMLRSQGTLEL